MSTVSTLSRSAEETLAVIQPWLKKAGVSRVADITGMDRIGIPVSISIRPDSRSLAVDSGKGTTRVQATTSSSMEALERWALDEVPIESFRGTYKNALTNFPLNRGAVVCDDGNQKLTNAVDLQTGEVVQVPYYAVKLYEGKEGLIEKPWYASTNGMSAGNTRDEAILSGLYEVIERDGVHLAMNRTVGGNPLPRIEQDSIADQVCINLIEQIESAGARVFIYDCRNEIAVPAFQCILVDREKGVGLFKGYGCHSDKWVALTRSICEACQSRAVIFAGARDDITWSRHRKLVADSNAREWTKDLSAEKATVTLDEIVNRDPGLIFDQLFENGLRVLVVDFHITDAPFSCVKVMVPGTAGYWNNYCELGRPK